jgi:hypothetical protein
VNPKQVLGELQTLEKPPNFPQNFKENNKDLKPSSLVSHSELLYSCQTSTEFSQNARQKSISLFKDF